MQICLLIAVSIVALFGRIDQVAAQDFAPKPQEGWAALPNPQANARGMSALPASFSKQEAMALEATAPTEARFDQFDRGELIAVVGEECILVGDIYPFIESQMKEIEDKAPKDMIPMLREKLTRQALGQYTQSKLLAQDFINEQVKAKPLNERDEARKQMEKQITKVFYETILPSMRRSQKVDTDLELDQALRKEGTSLRGQFEVFKATGFAQQAVEKNVPKKFEIELFEMKDYYETHIEDFRRPARAKFRELVALFSKCDSVEKAQELISQMGNEVYLGGASFESVSKRLSHSVRAAAGGTYDWTTQGALKSKKIDEVVFSIPLKRLSLIIEDTDGFKIVEVLERESARTIPFEEAQLEIRDRLNDEKRRKARETLLERLKAENDIWSKWPEDIPGAKPLSELIASPRGAELVGDGK
jgi:parvulin-like peptidyl-prolyl isomerase